MSISDITSVSGYTATQYEELVETAAAKGVSASEVNTDLLAALNAGKSFTEAVDSVAADLPLLDAPPSRSASDYYACSSIASPGAAVFAIMIDSTAEERRDNAELRISQTEVIASKMEAEADEMRKKAVTQLVLGVVSSAVTIGFGALTAGMAGSAVGSDAGFTTADNAKVTAMGQIGTGIAGLFSTTSDVAGTFFDANIKDMEADIARQETFRDILDSLDEALSQQISKAISTMESIQSDMNQTRTRILG